MAVTRNPNLGPSQMRARRRRLFFIRFSIVLFFLLVIIIALAILSGHEKVKVETINISGNATTTSNEVLAIARQDMAGRYFYLFSKSNSLIFPRFQIKKDILMNIKTIKDVDISWTGWKEISITLFERKAHSVWCGNDMETINSVCFLVDKEGYIYSLAPVFSGSMFIKNYGPLAPNQLNNISHITPIGSYFLPKNIYTQIYNLIDILDQNNLKIVSVSFDGFDYKFTLEAGPKIIFNEKNDFNSSFQNLFTAIETKNLDLVKDASLINYIDLRFDNKIVIGKKEK